MFYLQVHILECKKEIAMVFVNQNSLLIVEIKINYKLTGREYFDSALKYFFVKWINNINKWINNNIHLRHGLMSLCNSSKGLHLLSFQKQFAVWLKWSIFRMTFLSTLLISGSLKNFHLFELLD